MCERGRERAPVRLLALVPMLPIKTARVRTLGRRRSERPGADATRPTADANGTAPRQKDDRPQPCPITPDAAQRRYATPGVQILQRGLSAATSLIGTCA